MAIAPQDQRAAARFVLVGAAQRFVWEATPFRDQDSDEALSTLMNAARDVALPTADIDAILLRAALLLEDFVEPIGPSLIERYVSGRRLGADPLTRFSEVATAAFVHRARRTISVQRAVAIIESEYEDPKFSWRAFATRLAGSLDHFCREFYAQVRMYPSEYLQRVRLDHSAYQLKTTDRSVKEVWVAVGYGNASTFDHQFKRRFGVSPREYRVGSMIDIPRPVITVDAPDERGDVGRPRAQRHQCHILVVDDDEFTRCTISRYLRLEGYSVTVVETGEAALELVNHEIPDAALIDQYLPGMSGSECLRRLRVLNVAAPVIMFSADLDLETRRYEFTPLGADVLSKLCDLEDICAALESRACVPAGVHLKPRKSRPAWS